MVARTFIAPKNNMKMNDNSPQLGIDVSKFKLDVVLLLSNQTHTATFVNTLKGFTALARWLAGLHPTPRVCLEATGTYGLPIARFLHARGLRVSIVNPLAVHFFARTRMSRNKTDAHDAMLIALYAQQHQPRVWQPPTPAKEQLQQLIRLREQVLASRVLAQQHLESAPAPSAKCFRAQIRFLDRQIASVEAQLRSAVKTDIPFKQALSLLMTIPGVGFITAVTVLAIIPPMNQLESARQLAAFAGLTPSQRQSGLFTGRSRLSKMGHGRLRKALYFPALAALRYNRRVQSLAIRLAQKGKRKMVIVGAAMRLLTHLIFGVLKHQMPFDPNYQTKGSHRAAASLQLAPGGG
jgi:transposase